MVSWIVSIVVLVVIVGAYIWLYRFSKKRQKEFDEQYEAAKTRQEVFVLNKKIVKERPKQGWAKYMRFKTYQVVGRMNVSQSVRGVQMSRMHTFTFHTSKAEYDKIQINHRYKMDVSGNYIGYVAAPAPLSEKEKKAKAKAEAKQAQEKAKAKEAAKEAKANAKEANNQTNAKSGKKKEQAAKK